MLSQTSPVAAHLGRFLKIPPLILIFCLSIQTAIGKDIYVDSMAPSDTGKGTMASPKKFLASGLAMMSAAGGDTVILAPGSYSTPGDAITRSMRPPNGKPGAYNVIRAAIDGSVSLTREFSLPLTSAYLQFEGLTWDGAYT